MDEPDEAASLRLFRTCMQLEPATLRLA